MKYIEDVRSRSNAFVARREWAKFHQPINICLALAGECGEVCEIFQWKTSKDSGGSISNALEYIPFSDEEIVHIGEEISDVFIYSTRLCDLCNCDLAFAVRSRLQNGWAATPTESISNGLRCNSGKSWADTSFQEVSESLLAIDHPYSKLSSRALALALQTEMGKVCQIFLGKSEDECAVGLPQWEASEISLMASLLATMIVLLACLASQHGLALADVIDQKFEKNDRKYPAHLAKGSSAKYTAYTNEIAATAAAASSSSSTPAPLPIATSSSSSSVSASTSTSTSTHSFAPVSSSSSSSSSTSPSFSPSSSTMQRWLASNGVALMSAVAAAAAIGFTLGKGSR